MSVPRIALYGLGMAALIGGMLWLWQGQTVEVDAVSRDLSALGERVREVEREFGSPEAALAAGRTRLLAWVESVEAEEQQRRLARARSHEDPYVRWVAWASWPAPAAVDLEALEQLLTGVDDTAPRVRALVEGQIGNLQDLSHRARKRLELLARDRRRSASLRAACVQALARQPNMDALFVALAQTDLADGPPLDAALAYALSRSPIEAAMKALPDDIQRRVASELVLITLPGRLQGDRVAAMQALARFGRFQGVVDALMEALLDEDIAIRGTATNALSDLGTAAIDTVVDRLEDSETPRSEGLEFRLVWILERMRLPESKARLEALAQGTQPTVALRARLALEPRGPGRVGILGEVLRGPVGPGTSIALDHAARMGRAAEGLEPTVRLLIAHDDPEIAEAARETLQAIRPDATDGGR